jgi:hypothetical protein
MYKDRRHKGGNGALSMQVRLLNVYTKRDMVGARYWMLCYEMELFSKILSSPVVISIKPD